MESKAVSLCELLGLPLCLLGFSEHVSSQQTVVINLAFASLQGKTEGRMQLQTTDWMTWALEAYMKHLKNVRLYARRQKWYIVWTDGESVEREVPSVL